MLSLCVISALAFGFSESRVHKGGVFEFFLYIKSHFCYTSIHQMSYEFFERKVYIPISRVAKCVFPALLLAKNIWKSISQHNWLVRISILENLKVILNIQSKIAFSKLRSGDNCFHNTCISSLTTGDRVLPPPCQKKVPTLRRVKSRIIRT